MADPLTTTLVLMYFITTPAKAVPGESKEVRESKAVWTLQSTDHIETGDSTRCVLYAQQLLEAVRPVNTLTLRAYCLCPNGDGDKNCYAPTLDAQIAAANAGKSKPTIQAIGPKTKLPPPPPNGATQ